MRTHPSSRPTRAAACLLIALALFWLGAAAAPESVAGLPTAASAPTWERTGGAGPPARADTAMAFDPDGGTTVLFGGRGVSGLLADTWTWDGSGWTEGTPPTSPPAVESATMAYDAASHQLLLFGGAGSAGQPTADTWTWDGTTWTRLAPAASPPARSAASLVYDPATATVVLFGGFSASGASLGDTWSWDGMTWKAASPADSPPSRGAAAAAYDAVGDVVVISGGRTGSQVLGDTWAWNGLDWGQRNPSAAPAPRADAAAAALGDNRGTALFGGDPGAAGPLDDLWTWDGDRWVATPASGAPPARSRATLAVGPAGTLVLFGGLGTSGILGDTWTLTTLPAKTATTAPSTTTTAPTTTTSGRPPASSVSPPSGATAAGPPVSSGPTTTTPPPTAVLGVTARSVHVGDQLTLSGSGFAPGATVNITFRSVPIVVASVITDATGRFSVSVLVPGDAAAGQHHFEAEGPALGGGLATLLAPVSVTVAGRGHSLVLPIAMAVFTVLLAGAAWLVLTRLGGQHRVGGMG
jgi:hypothetical protein